MKLRFGWTVKRADTRRPAALIRSEHLITPDEIADLLALWMATEYPEHEVHVKPTLVLGAKRAGEIVRRVLREQGTSAFEVTWGDCMSVREANGIREWARAQVAAIHPDEARQTWGQP